METLSLNLKPYLVRYTATYSETKHIFTISFEVSTKDQINKLKTKIDQINKVNTKSKLGLFSNFKTMSDFIA